MKISVLACTIAILPNIVSMTIASLSMPAPGHEAFHEGRMEKQTGLLLLSKVSVTNNLLVVLSYH